MAVSVFLGGFGFGNLGDEACLAIAYSLYKLDTNCCFTHDQIVTEKAAKFDFFFNHLSDLLNRYERIDRVIIAGGGVGFMPSFKDNLDWAFHCKNKGAEVIVHNIGIGKIGGEWAKTWPYLADVLKEAKEFSVRDFRSKAEAESWGIGVSPPISYFPERNHPVNPRHAHLIPANKQLLGISINNRPQLWETISQNKMEISRLLSAFTQASILPIVSTIHSVDEDERDDKGFLRFVEMFGLEDRVVAKELCDYSFWYKNIGPGDVKYFISRCEFLLSARKHNIIHAIGNGVPFAGLFEFDNDSIARVYHTLYPDLPKNSSLFPIFPL